MLKAKAQWIVGLQAGDDFGEKLGGGGDINRDGYDDILIGAQDAGLGGELAIIFGRSTWAMGVSNVVENTNSSTVIYDATASDEDVGDTLTYTVGGADKDL